MNHFYIINSDYFSAGKNKLKEKLSRTYLGERITMKCPTILICPLKLHVNKIVSNTEARKIEVVFILVYEWHRVLRYECM